MPGEPKVEEWNWNYRQQQGDLNWQTNPKIQNKVNDQSKEGSNAVIDGKNGKQIISRLSFIRVPTFWASIERHKPIFQRANLKPWNEQRAFAARWTFPA